MKVMFIWEILQCRLNDSSRALVERRLRVVSGKSLASIADSQSPRQVGLSRSVECRLAFDLGLRPTREHPVSQYVDCRNWQGYQHGSVGVMQAPNTFSALQKFSLLCRANGSFGKVCLETCFRQVCRSLFSNAALDIPAMGSEHEFRCTKS